MDIDRSSHRNRSYCCRNQFWKAKTKINAQNWKPNRGLKVKMRRIAHACIGQNPEWFSILFVEIENLDRWDHRHESNQGWEIDFGQQTKQTRASRTKSMLQNHDAPMSVDMGVLNGRSRIKHEILSAAFWDTSIGRVNDVDQMVSNPCRKSELDSKEEK